MKKFLSNSQNVIDDIKIYKKISELSLQEIKQIYE